VPLGDSKQAKDFVVPLAPRWPGPVDQGALENELEAARNDNDIRRGDFESTLTRIAAAAPPVL
jgi:hypothetical protein